MHGLRIRLVPEIIHGARGQALQRLLVELVLVARLHRADNLPHPLHRCLLLPVQIWGAEVALAGRIRQKPPGCNKPETEICGQSSTEGGLRCLALYREVGGQAVSKEAPRCIQREPDAHCYPGPDRPLLTKKLDSQLFSQGFCSCKDPEPVVLNFLRR